MTELSQIVSRHIAAAERPGDIRSDLFNRYMGELIGDEVDARSKAMTSEVFDTVEAMAAEIMDMVAAEQDMVSFRPKGPGDEIQAAKETAALNHVFWEKNNGFENLQTWLKAGLIEQVGYCRSGWVEAERVTIEEYNDLTIADALGIKQRFEADPDVDEVELLDKEGFTEDPDLGYIPEFDEDGMPLPVSFKLRCVKTVDEYEVEPIPQNCVLITPRWHKISVQDVPFLGIEHSEYTRSDLIAMGFHKDDVDDLSFEMADEEEENRHNTKDNFDDGTSSVEKATEVVRCYECFIRSDRDGDGIAERLKVWVGTDMKTILRWADETEAVEEVDTVDVSAWTPIVVPHRHVGRSAAETVDDIQAINTTLLRQTLDAGYATLYPRPVVDENSATENTYADLARPDHGAPIRVRGMNGVAWPQPPNIAGATLQLMEKMNAIREERTGVTRLNQGMDSETLNQTASGQKQLLTQGQKRIKLIARNFAEGVRDLFVRMHRDMRRGNVRKLEYLHSGEWANEDPLMWPERREMNVSVGTGNGDKAEKQMTISAIGQVQREMMASGSDLVDEIKLFETIDRAVKLGGFSGAALFLNDPRSPEYKQRQQMKPPPQPTAEMVLAQAEASKAQAQAAKADADAQEALARIALDAQKAKQDHERRLAELRLEETKIAAGIQTNAEKQDLAEKAQAEEMALERDKLAVGIMTDA